MDRWLMEDKEELERNEVDSDLKSTASCKPIWKKTTKDNPNCTSRGLASMITCIIVDALHKMAPTRRSGPNNNENPDIAAIIAQQLQTILPQIVTQVTNIVNNANGGNSRNSGNGRNNGCTYKGFMACNPKEYDGKGGAIALTRCIVKMENVIDNSVQARGREAVIGANHVGYTDRFHELAKLVPHLVTPESSRIKRAGILTDEAVNYGTLTKGNDKRKVVEESGKSGGSWKDNKKAK
ncbi:hypothetical protein Tco_1137989, partial [Tanacetum coccineum]